ncbi:MAG: hypothetical protein KDA84_01490 [Planctomycetaceae bacterium]|nr:hypothetical protein [Planctomycetaceae bacterium]
MFQGISLSFRSLPESLWKAIPNLENRLHRRSEHAEPEIWFLVRDRVPLLPVLWDGQMQLVRWGRPGPNQSRIWQCPREDLEKGKWSAWEPEPVQIPADFARDNGVWFDVREGLQGVVIQGKAGPEVYVLTQPASHYYEVMCSHAECMPCLIGQWV